MAQKAPITVHLLAPGPSAWQMERRVQGDMDLPLANDAIAQLGEAAAKWQPKKIKTIHCGPDEASRRSAELYAQVADARVRSTDQLAEMNLGVWQGLLESELRERSKKTFNNWRSDPRKIVMPQGADFGKTEQRLRAELSRIMQRVDSKAVGIVLHPVVRRIAFDWLIGGEEQPPLVGPPTEFIHSVTLDKEQLAEARSLHKKFWRLVS